MSILTRDQLDSLFAQFKTKGTIVTDVVRSHLELLDRYEDVSDRLTVPPSLPDALRTAGELAFGPDWPFALGHPSGYTLNELRALAVRIERIAEQEAARAAECHAESPDWVCTRGAAHDGPHVSTNPNSGEVCAVWTDDGMVWGKAA